MKTSILNIVLILILSAPSGAQTILPDSLRNKLKRSDDTTKIIGLNSVGAFFNDEGEPDSALVYFRRAAELSKQLNYELGVLVACKGISDAYLMNERVPEAIDYLLKIFEIRKKNGDKKTVRSLL